MEEINNRIKQEICYKIIQDLSDECLINQYKECISVKNEIKKYINNETKEKIIDEYLLNLIPPGTKGVIRGNKFNDIIKNFIINLNLDKNIDRNIYTMNQLKKFLMKLNESLLKSTVKLISPKLDTELYFIGNPKTVSSLPVPVAYENNLLPLKSLP